MSKLKSRVVLRGEARGRLCFNTSVNMLSDPLNNSVLQRNIKFLSIIKQNVSRISKRKVMSWRRETRFFFFFWIDDGMTIYLSFHAFPAAILLPRLDNISSLVALKTSLHLISACCVSSVARRTDTTRMDAIQPVRCTRDATLRVSE